MNIIPYRRKIQFYETDLMGIVHHSNYIRWFEEARVHYMEKLGYGYEKASKTGIDFAVINISCDYKSMVTFGDDVDIFVYLTSLSPAKFTISYEVYNVINNNLCTTGKSTHCFYHNQRKRPVSLQKEIPDLYNLFLQYVEKTT